MDRSYLRELKMIDQLGARQGKTHALAALCKEKGWALLVSHYAATKLVDCDSIFVGQSLRGRTGPVIIDTDAFALIIQQMESRFDDKIGYLESTINTIDNRVKCASLWQRIKYLFTKKIY